MDNNMAGWLADRVTEKQGDGVTGWRGGRVTGWRGWGDGVTGDMVTKRLTSVAIGTQQIGIDQHDDWKIPD